MTGAQVYGMLKVSKVGECFLLAHRALDATLELAGLGQDGKPIAECRGLFAKEATMQRAFGIDLEIDDAFGNWLAGFTDGEGCFMASALMDKSGYKTLRLSLQIKLRADDLPILQSIQKALGVGHIHRFERTGKPGHPQCQYKVSAIGDLFWVIVPLFEKFPLRAKKAKDFAAWKKVVTAKYHQGKPRGLGRGHGRASIPQSFWDKITPLIQALDETRVFEEPNIERERWRG